MAAPAPAAVVPTSASDLFDLLHKTGLFKPDVLNEKLGEFDFPPDAPGAAAVLVRAGLLTQFQAKLLLAGKYRGFKLGTYHIRDQIGRGGMGTVYLAEHATLRRKVAAKVLAADGATQKAGVERFLREARAAAALDHPNIVRVFDVLQSGELHYIVMEYVEGKTLDSLVQGGGAMAPGRAVSYISQAAAGLQHAYEKGFVHRDIKPANLMVAKDGTVKILDMGLARSTVDDGDRVTEILDEGAVVGTADFISPEQATNQPGVDIRADIYSLGATLFALIAGQPPFQGSTSQVLMQHQLKAPPSLADFDRTIAPGLAAVVAKMLAKKPAERFATPSDVIAALAPWLPNRDGAQKVMAGLSSSEMGRHSGSLQNTIEQVLSSSTRNLPRPDLAAEAGKRKLMGGLVAAAGLAAAILGGAALWIVKGGLEPGPGTRKEGGPGSVEVVTAPTPKNLFRTEGKYTLLSLADAANAASDVPIYGGRDFFRLTDWGRREVNGVPFDLTPMPSTGNSTGGGKYILFRGIPGPQASTGPVRVSLPVGRPAAAVHFLGGVASYAWPFEGREVGDDPLGKVVMTVRLNYADGKEELFPWKNGEQVADYIRQNEVPGSEFAFTDTDGHQVRYLTVVPSRPMPITSIDLIKGDFSSAPMVYAVTVEGPGSAAAGVTAKADTAALYRFDPAGLPEFRGTKQGWDKVLYGSFPALPPGIRVSSWKATATADFTRATVAGRPALGFAARGADPTAEVIFVLDELGVKLRPDVEYLARLDYLTEGDATAALRAQEDGGSFPVLTEQPLSTTDGKWRTVELKFKKAAGVTRLVVQADKSSEAGMLHLGRLEVVDPATAAVAAPTVPTGKPVLFRFDAGGVPEFRAGLLKNKAREEIPAELAKTTYVGCFNENATGELVRIARDGVPALGIAARSGMASAQVVWDLNSDEFDPAREYVLRVTHQSHGDVGGTVLVQNVSSNYVGLATVNILPGNDWQTTELKFKRPAGSAIKLAFQSLKLGPADGMAYIRSVEVADPAAQPAARSLFKLNLAEVGSFRQVVRNRTKLSGTDGRFPAGVGPYAWKPETEAEFAVEPVDGVPSLQLTNRSGPSSAQIMLNMESPENGMGLTLAPGKGYELRLEYKTSGRAAGRTYTQSADYKETGEGMALPDTGGQWKPFSYPFTRGPLPLRLLIDLDGNGIGKSLYLRSVELVEAGAGPTTVASAPAVAVSKPVPVGAKVLSVNMAELPTFRGQFADGHAGDGVPTGIPGLGWYCWKKESVAEFRGEPTDAGPALGMTNLNDDTSAQFNLPLDEAPGDVKLQDGKKYVLRVQYRTTNDAFGTLQLRTPDYNTAARADLAGTGGQWRWADLPFTRTDGQKLHAVLENATVGEGNTLWLRAAELHEAK